MRSLDLTWLDLKRNVCIWQTTDGAVLGSAIFSIFTSQSLILSLRRVVIIIITVSTPAENKERHPRQVFGDTNTNTWTVTTTTRKKTDDDRDEWDLKMTWEKKREKKEKRCREQDKKKTKPSGVASFLVILYLSGLNGQNKCRWMKREGQVGPLNKLNNMYNHLKREENKFTSLKWMNHVKVN